MLRTLQVGRWAPLWTRGSPDPWDAAKQGRFSPAVGFEYNWIAKISRTPTAYYGFNAIQLVVFVWLLLKILR